MSVEISVICVVSKHATELPRVHREFTEALERTGRSFEFVYVFDGPRRKAEQELADELRGSRPVRMLKTARGFGEATALSAAFERVSARYVLTIPDRPQIDPAVVGDVIDKLDEGIDAVVTRREPRSDAKLNQLQSRAFHALVRWFVHKDFHDMSCGVRGFTLEAARKLDLYGDQHRFIPVLAVRRGCRVVEIPGAQHGANTALRLRKPGVYVRRLLDILNIYFLTRFTRKPLRFFGLIGIAVGGTGFAISAYLAVQRLLGLSALADRPLLLLGVLLIVLGVQMTSIGLLGEIIIFFSTRREMPDIAEDSEWGAGSDSQSDTRRVTG